LRGEEASLCIINGGRKVRTRSADHKIKKIKHTDYKATEAEIFEPSVMQIIIGTSKSLVQIHFFRKSPVFEFQKRKLDGNIKQCNMQCRFDLDNGPARTEGAVEFNSTLHQ
jgi:hypothetical protein